MSEDTPPIVMDIGSASCKVGFAGDDDPKCVLPTVVGKPKHQFEESRNHVGYEALNRRALLRMTSPVERGAVTDWDDVMTIWNHIFKDEFTANLSEHAVLVTDASGNPKEHRERLAQVLFEKYQVPALFIAHPGVLSLYAAGRTTGLVLDVGHGVTTALPVYEGYAIASALCRQDLAGADLTSLMMKSLTGRDYRFATASSKQDAQTLKEKHCYVSMDYQKDLATIKNGAPAQKFELPDGKVIDLGTERVSIPETLFDPQSAGRPASEMGLPQMVQAAVTRCEVDTRRPLYKTVILTGGSSMFPGLVERLKRDLAPLCPFKDEVHVSAAQNRLLSAWIGGSVLASQSSMETMWVERKDFLEEGPEVLHKKCFYV